jgi:sugar phosphate isomerase/epimerase
MLWVGRNEKGLNMRSPPDLAKRLGCTTATFGCKLPEKLRAMRQAGFIATEFFPRDLFEDPRGPDYAVAIVRESGLAISAYQALRDYEGMPTPKRGHVLGIAEQMMDQMAWLNARLLVLCANMHPDASGDRERCATDLTRLADLARSRGIRVAYEPIGWARWHADYREAWALMCDVNHPNFGLMLDSLHVASSGLPLNAIDSFDPAKIFLVELCDWPQTRLSPFEIARHYRLFPGEGVGPLTEFVQRLERVGYRGNYSLEVMNDHYFHVDPAKVAQRGMDATLRLSFTA